MYRDSYDIHCFCIVGEPQEADDNTDPRSCKAVQEGLGMAAGRPASIACFFLGDLASWRKKSLHTSVFSHHRGRRETPLTQFDSKQSGKSIVFASQAWSRLSSGDIVLHRTRFSLGGVAASRAYVSPDLSISTVKCRSI